MANAPTTPSTPDRMVPAKKATKPATSKPVTAKSAPANPVAAKPAAKPTSVTLMGKAVVAGTEKAKKPAKIAETEKQPKAKKPKLVRDSFTIPKDEYQVIDTLKQRSAKLGQAMKKSELLRAGIKLLNSLDDVQFKQAAAAVPAIKTGRPKKSK